MEELEFVIGVVLLAVGVRVAPYCLNNTKMSGVRYYLTLLWIAALLSLSISMLAAMRFNQVLVVLTNFLVVMGSILPYREIGREISGSRLWHELTRRIDQTER